MQEQIQDLINNSSPIDIRAALFKKGDFDFIVKGKNEDGDIVTHEKQKQALKILTSNIYDEFLFGGAAGGSKTWTGCSWMLFMAICYPGTKYFIARDELKDLLESVKVTFDKVAKAYGFTDYKFNAVKNFIQFGNGSHINFIDLKYKPSDPNYEDVGSTEYTCGWIEEASQINEKGATVISSRVGRHLNAKYGIKGIVFYTTNPKRNWLKRDFYDKWKNGTLEKEKFYLPCYIYDNPFLEKDYVRKMQLLVKKDKASYERLYKGNWDYEDNPFMLCEQEMIEAVFNNNHVPYGKRCITADVARFGSDKAVIGYWSGWQLLDVITLDISKTTDIELAIKTFRFKYKVATNRVIVDADGVGCISYDTEVLTKKGWKKAKDLKKEDVLISKDINGIIYYQKPKEIQFLESERFIETESGYRFTETHAHFYKTRKNNLIKIKYWDDITDFKAFYNDTYVNDTVLKQYSSKGIAFKQQNKPDLKIDIGVFCSFLGWMSSDGSLDNWNNKHVLRISQAVKSPNNNKIKSILDEMGVNYIIKKQNDRLYQYEFQNKDLFNFILDECYFGKPNFETKKVCDFIKRQNKKNIMKYLKSFNDGDGYYHKGLMQFVGTNKILLDGIQELLFYCGIRSKFYIKHKKGSKGCIDGRVFNRTRDCYLLSQLSKSNYIKVGKTKKYFDKAVNIFLGNETKAYLIRMNDEIFWTHNGGVVDGTGARSFRNNAKPIRTGKDMPNYKNLQVQCLYALAEKVNEGAIWIKADLTNDEKEQIKEELSQIQSKGDQDPERKLDCKSKAEIKQDIGRSPDWRDMLFMRVYFDLKKNLDLSTNWE